jgi:hypothetical protein
VQFSRRDREHNFHVGVDCYFYAKQHGFNQAKQMAIGYRKRLEQEWEEAEAGWKIIDAERASAKQAAQQERQILARIEKEQQSPQIEASS